MTVRTGRCSVRKEIGGNMEIRKFVREEGRKVDYWEDWEIENRDGRWIWIW